MVNVFFNGEKAVLTAMVQGKTPERIKELMDKCREEGAEAFGMQFEKLLHEYRKTIIGRMGLPYPAKNISIISVAVDGPMNEISALSGKLGAIKGVSTKTIYSKA